MHATSRVRRTALAARVKLVSRVDALVHRWVQGPDGAEARYLLMGRVQGTYRASDYKSACTLQGFNIEDLAPGERP